MIGMVYDRFREVRTKAIDSIGAFEIGSTERKAAERKSDLIDTIIGNLRYVSEDSRPLVEENRKYKDPVGEMLQRALGNLNDRRRPIKYLIDEPLRSQLGDVEKQVSGALSRIDNRTMGEDEYNSLMNLESDFARKVKFVEHVWSPFRYRYQEAQA